MTYGRDHQPDIRFQGDGLARGLHSAQSQVRSLAREMRNEIRSIRTTYADRPDYIRASKLWIRDAWGARRSAQQAVVAYRNLIAERDQQRRILEAS